MFQDSGEHEMKKNFLSSQAVSYKEVQEAVSEAQRVDGTVNIVVTLEEQIPLDATQLEPYIEKYILIFSVWISSI